VRRAVVAIVLSSASLCALVPSAWAGRAEVIVRKTPEGELIGIDEVESLRYTAAPGEVNRVRVTFQDPGVFLISDPVGISLGRKCSRPVAGDPTRARCVSSIGNEAFLLLGDRNDTATSGPSQIGGVFCGACIFSDMDGGPGNDALSGDQVRGGEGADALAGAFVRGGKGNDRLSVRPGDSATFLEGDRGNGSDTIVGGDSGEDTVSYEGRRRGVSVSLDGRRNDGAPGENDQITGVESIYGGRGRDRLTGESGVNDLRGFGGSDRISGRGGSDTLSGFDEAEPGRGRTRDRITGGTGDDTIYGSAGSDRVKPGPGQDDLTLYRGNERVNLRDRSIDTVECGRGRDRVKLDRQDFAWDRCERTRRRGAAAAVALATDADARFEGDPDQPFVTIGCPLDGPRACRGTASILLRGRRTARKRFRIRRGRVKELKFRPSLLRQLEGKPVRIVVRSRDRRGRRSKRVRRAKFVTAACCV